MEITDQIDHIDPDSLKEKIFSKMISSSEKMNEMIKEGPDSPRDLKRWRNEIREKMEEIDLSLDTLYLLDNLLDRCPSCGYRFGGRS